MRMKKAVFLDRDGVINKKREDYVKSVSEFILLEDAPKAIRLLNENGFSVIIITNQSAVNRGLISHEDLEKIHESMKLQLKEYNSFIDAIYYCPHRPEENCYCRKPKTGLLKQAMKDLSVRSEDSWFIGDCESDREAAKREGIRFIKVETDSGLLNTVKKICE